MLSWRLRRRIQMAIEEEDSEGDGDGDGDDSCGCETLTAVSDGKQEHYGEELISARRSFLLRDQEAIEQEGERERERERERSHGERKSCRRERREERALDTCQLLIAQAPANPMLPSGTASLSTGISSL
jgi:3'-phosphoadenosine 5'-phosphosulfate sulfotransferase (PAPS reductase)/FAD synthetase